MNNHQEGQVHLHVTALTIQFSITQMGEKLILKLSHKFQQQYKKKEEFETFHWVLVFFFWFRKNKKQTNYIFKSQARLSMIRKKWAWIQITRARKTQASKKKNIVTQWCRTVVIEAIAFVYCMQIWRNLLATYTAF